MSLTPEKVAAGIPMIGTVVGSYKITKQIGAGGMGAVYEAEHGLLGKKAAVKVLLPRMSVDKEVVRRFFNEAKAISLIQHPGIVEVYDYGHLANGDAFIVMELLEGENLGTRLKRIGKLTVNNAIATARHIAGVLAEAHRHGIIHRDLKPDNIYLVPDAALPRGERAKVLDFGIAKLSGDEGDALETKTGQILGTPMYMSPEQCKGAGKLDHRSDIYALGCLLYQMLCGRPPFIGEGSGEILAAQIHIAPSPIQAHDASIPDSMSEVVMKLLEKDPASRYQTMSDVIDALNNARPRTEIDTEPSLASSNEFYQPDQQETQTMLPIDSETSPAAQAERMGAHTLDSLTTPPPASNRRLTLIAISAISMAVVIFAVVTLMGGSETEQPTNAALPSSPPPEHDALIQPVSDKRIVEADALGVDASGSTQAVPNVESKTVVLVIDSDPSGAKVYRESDGVRLGQTPYKYTIKRGAGYAGFLLKKSGYHRAEIEMPINQDGSTTVELIRRGKSQSEPTPNVPEDKTTPEGTEGDKLPAAEPEDDKTPDKTPELPAGKDDALDPFAAQVP
ncbi:MAG: serine/threonine protein kinase, partial [Kofleriaceae bacterium]|nr:serine/threonine protein kinase [Kofleriaceae bacterium]